MQLIAGQYEIAWQDKIANHGLIREWLCGRAPEPGSLILLPEMCDTGFSMNLAEVAPDRSRRSEAFFARLAKELEIYLVAGLVRRGADGLGRNEAVVFSPEGLELARYAKLHPFSHVGEDRHFAAGDRLAIFDWQGIKVAPIVCYDLRFPELFRHAVRAGAELFAVIANWPAARTAHWRPLLRARAIENQAIVVGLNRCGEDPNARYDGQSVVYDPQGVALAEADRDPTLLECDIDRQVIDDTRRSFGVLRDMRDDLLGPPSYGLDEEQDQFNDQRRG